MQKVVNKVLVMFVFFKTAVNENKLLYTAVCSVELTRLLSQRNIPVARRLAEGIPLLAKGYRS